MLAWVGEVSMFGARALRDAWRRPWEIDEIGRQIYDIGWRSAPLIFVSGVAVGVVLSMHTRASLERFGAEAMIPAGLAIAMIRETGPLTAGLLLSGRVGAGIGAELGAMKVTEQIDALEAATVKTAVFGFIIGTVSSYLGFSTSQGTEGVGRASTRSVVLSSILIILAD